MSGTSPPGDADQVTVYSIGHSNQTLDAFIRLLKRHQIQSLVDVRSAPYSRYVPHFNRPALEDAVERRGVRYVFMGDELGGRPPGDDYYDALDHVLYYRVAEAPFFLRGLEKLIEEGGTYRTAMMCSEEDPTNCHRHLLIARVLESQGVRVLHIRGDDREQTEDDLRPVATLWGEELSAEEEEAKWKSIRPVSRRRALPSSSKRSDEWGSDDF